MKRSTNPSAVESQKRIIEALIDLMQVKNIKDISISEIAENAEVVRRTFYRNFSSKEDVLDAYFDIVFAETTKAINKLGDKINCLMSVREIIRICYKHQNFFVALKNSDMLGYMQNKWNTALPVLHDIFLNRLTNFPEIKDKQTLDYLLTFNVGGTFNIIIKWINDGMKLSPDELADIIENFAFGTMYRDCSSS